MVVLVGLANAPHALERPRISQVPAEGIAGVGRVGDQAPLANNVGRPADEAHLGIDRV